MLNPTVRIGNNYFAQINGNAFPNAPDFNLQGKTNFTLYKTVEYTADGNYELGAKVGYAFRTYTIAVFARNLTNTKNLVDAIDTSNYRAGIENDPRVIGVMISGRSC